MGYENQDFTQLRPKNKVTRTKKSKNKFTAPGKSYSKYFKKQNDKEKRLDRREDPLVKFKEYQSNAFRRNIEFNLTFDQAKDLFSKECFYCGKKKDGKLSGIDRLDSQNKGSYCVQNCVSCCKTCNFMKGTLGAKQFLEQCISISTQFGMSSDRLDEALILLGKRKITIYQKLSCPGNLLKDVQKEFTKETTQENDQATTQQRSQEPSEYLVTKVLG